MSKEKVLRENVAIEEKATVPLSVVGEYLKQIENFETDRVEGIKAQNKTAWRVASTFGLISVLSVGAVIAMLPLKTVEPYVIRVDNATGFTDVVRPIGNAKESYEEKLTRFWLGQFIQAREGYYWTEVEANYGKLRLMSNAQVFAQYETYIFADTSPVRVFEDSMSIKVDNLGTTFLDTPTGVVAQVRLSKTVLGKDGKPAKMYPVTHWLATATFDYKKEIKRQSEEDVNPLGFQVLSYRIDAINN